MDSKSLPPIINFAVISAAVDQTRLSVGFLVDYIVGEGRYTHHEYDEDSVIVYYQDYDGQRQHIMPLAAFEQACQIMNRG